MKVPKAFIKVLPKFREALEEWDEEVAARLSELEDKGEDSDSDELSELEDLQTVLATLNDALDDLPKEASE